MIVKLLLSILITSPLCHTLVSNLMFSSGLFQILHFSPVLKVGTNWSSLLLLSPSLRSLLKPDKLSILNKGKCETMDWAIPHVTLGERRERLLQLRTAPQISEAAQRQ